MLCINAIGSEPEFMNIAAAIAKFPEIITHVCQIKSFDKKTRVYHLCEHLNLNNQTKAEATKPEVAVTTRKITHNSRSFSVWVVSPAAKIRTEMILGV